WERHDLLADLGNNASFWLTIPVKSAPLKKSHLRVIERCPTQNRPPKLDSSPWVAQKRLVINSYPLNSCSE
ncbi:hypothetical protein, partial [Aeromonas sp. ZOR0001]|uniref:hypothetical protein n=1 Tax=Aeromonas sp. ZOR0001 TaxID=1339227 RepID=UPI001E284CA9